MFSKRVGIAPRKTLALAPMLVAVTLLSLGLSESIATAKLLRDPMVPPSQPSPKMEQKAAPKMKAAPVKLVLSAIRFKRATSLSTAIINGEWVSAGSTIDDATVVHIASGSVVLNRNGEEVTLKLVSDTSIKKRTSSAERPES